MLAQFGNSKHYCTTDWLGDSKALAGEYAIVRFAGGFFHGD